MPANIVIRIGASAGQAVSEINRVNSALGDQMSGADKASAAIKKAAVPAAIAFGAISVAAVGAAKAAIAYNKSQSELAYSLKLTTGATDAQVKASQDYVSQLSKTTAIAGGELRPALATIATATHDVTKAQEGLALAADLSAKSGKSLATTSSALAKAYAGQTTSLTRLVPGIDKAALATKDYGAINQAVADVAGGAAADAAQTQAGQMQNLALQTKSLQIQLGQALLPAMGLFVDIATRAVSVMSDHAGALEVVIAAVAVLSGGILAANAALKVYAIWQATAAARTAIWTAAQWLLNTALSANPIGLVIVAIAALAAGLVVAYTKSQTFRNIVAASMAGVMVAVNALASAFTFLWNAATAAFNWIKSHWTIAAFAFGPLGAAIVLIAHHFDTVKAAGVGAFNAIASAIGSITGVIQSAIGWVQRLIDSLSHIHVPSIHVPGINLAGGGYAYPSSALMRTQYAGAAGASYTINVSGATDPEGTARAIERVLRAHERRQGRA